MTEKSNMAAIGFCPCNSFAPICHKTLCNTTFSRFYDVRNLFLRSILCFGIIFKAITYSTVLQDANYTRNIINIYIIASNFAFSSIYDV